MTTTVNTAHLVKTCRDIADEMEKGGNRTDANIIRGLCHRAEELSPTPINWRDDPDAIVEDDEPMIGRDYA